jgi:hypothetical protein
VLPFVKSRAPEAVALSISLTPIIHYIDSVIEEFPVSTEPKRETVDVTGSCYPRHFDSNPRHII